MSKTLVIAEAGVNHNGDLSLAKKLIDIASDAGADIVKFQTFEASRLVARGAPKAEYQMASKLDTESQFEMLKKLELNEQMHYELIDYANAKNIEFLSTGFDIESMELLKNLGLRRIKIPSGEITNLPYLRYAGSRNCKILLSTGMSTLVEVEAAIAVLEKAGTMKENITLLHCTSAYPTPIEDVNLLAMLLMRDEFGIDVGYSDHTRSLSVPVAAAALGAKVIEKHFTLNNDLPGPDHKSSLNPNELEEMIKRIREVEVALGSFRKIPTPTEMENRKIARKSIVALRKITKGEKLSEDNIGTLRPGDGVSPMYWDYVLGQPAIHDYLPAQKIEITNIKIENPSDE